MEHREEEQFREERDRHERERNWWDQEVEKLQEQLQQATDEKTKQYLKDEVKITQAKREVAHSKYEKAAALEAQLRHERLKSAHRISMRGLVNKVTKSEEHLKKLESETKKKREQYAQSEQNLLEALKDGVVNVLMLLCFLVGLPGVGKTHLKFMLLGEQPPKLRSSTNCAEAPLRIEIRTTQLQAVGGRWKEVGDTEMFDVVAEMIIVAEPNIDIPPLEKEGEAPEPPKQSNSVFARIVSWVKRSSSFSEVRGASAQVLSSSVSATCRKAMDVILHKVIESIMKLRSQGLGRVASLRSSFCSKWVYFTDCGGQPQYHELLPLFVRRISCALCVIRLPDKLDEVQAVEYFKEGRRVGSAQQSQLTAKDTVQCLVNTVQSYSAQDHPPKIIMVGTHLDKLKELEQKSQQVEVDTDTHCQAATPTTAQDTRSQFETLEEKDRQLLEMLEPEFSNQLVYYNESSRPKKLLFPANTLNPGEHEKGMAQSLRGAVETSGAKEIKVPIWWYVMELLLQELAKELGRGVLSRIECLEMARLLNIKEESFNAALVYFDELNVIKYSPSVLPEVVFIDSQIPLDKVSELVYHSYLLNQPNSAEPIAVSLSDEELRHFRDLGVVSKDLLAKFNHHYVPEIFSVDDLTKYLKQRLAFAPIPKPGTTPSSKQKPADDQPSEEEETHFVVPALLDTLSKGDLEKRRVSSPVAATLLVRFPRGSRRAGVFCCFVVHLIRHCGWDLIFDSKEPLYRNFIRMRLLTSPPISVMLIDSNSYIEVHVNTTTGVPVGDYAGLLPIIKQAILSGIFAACKALNYQQTKPELTFYCPHTRPSQEASQMDGPPKPKQHTVTLTPDRKYWRCDLDPDTYLGLLEEEHSIWFGLPRGEDSSKSKRRTGAQKLFVKVPKSSVPSSRNLTLIKWRSKQGREEKFQLKDLICHKWKELGCLLEIPLPRLLGWEKKYREDPDDSINAVLNHWLEKPTQYYPNSWEGLEALLKDAKLGQVAEDLEQARSNAI